MDELCDKPLPSYVGLMESGALRRRAEILHERLRACDLCPRLCGVNRLEGELGFCRSGSEARVSSCNRHTGEEPPISGTGGSGTVFLSNCTMRCIFCQNFPISQQGHGKVLSDSELAGRFLMLQKMGVHNLNFVTPTHFSAAIARAICIAAEKGLRLPIVYNTSGYERVEVIRMLEGIVDIYMPDAKYINPQLAKKYSDAPDYVEHNLPALQEMQRQVGDLKFDEQGMARRGLLIRHLVLPGAPDDSIAILKMIRDQVSPHAFVSLMSQYFPAHRAHEVEPMDRRLQPEEYEKVLAWMEDSSLDGFVQNI
ncbi:MAG: radical SAM protein [Candidatus Sumerlaeia bacterium]